MLYRLIIIFLGHCLLNTAALQAQSEYDFELVDFKTVGSDTLRLHLFEPAQEVSEKPRPAKLGQTLEPLSELQPWLLWLLCCWAGETIDQFPAIEGIFKTNLP